MVEEGHGEEGGTSNPKVGTQILRLRSAHNIGKKNIADQGKGQSCERSSEQEPLPVTCPRGLVSCWTSGAVIPTGVEPSSPRLSGTTS